LPPDKNGYPASDGWASRAG